MRSWSIYSARQQPIFSRYKAPDDVNTMARWPDRRVQTCPTIATILTKDIAIVMQPHFRSHTASTSFSRYTRIISIWRFHFHIFPAMPCVTSMCRREHPRHFDHTRERNLYKIDTSERQRLIIQSKSRGKSSTGKTRIFVPTRSRLINSGS